MPSTRKRYPNPAREGSFLVLSDEGAKKLGLNPKDGTPHKRPGPAPVDVTNEGGAAIVSSSTVASDVNAPKGKAKPEGALEPGGPTSRARRAAEAAAAEAPTEGPVEEGEVVEGPVEEGEVVDDSKASEPKTSRRRRASS